MLLIVIFHFAWGEYHETMEINIGTAELIVNDKLKKVELYTSAVRYWCINTQPCFPINAMSVIFSVKKT